MATPSAAAKLLITRIGPSDRPRPVVDVIAELAIAEGWETQADAAREWAERTQRSVMAYLRRYLGSMNEVGRPSAFVFNSSSEYLIQGAAFVEPRDDDSIGEAKRRVSRLGSYVDALMALDPPAFEALCAGVPSALGVSNPAITARSRDEGVDFYGELRFDSILLRQDAFPTIHRQMKIWLVGQAKRYRTGQVSTPDLRELVGSVELARAHALAEPSGSPMGMRIRVCDPVACLFFTTGTISSAGWAMSDRAGIIAMDGSMIASFLAEREIGVKSGCVDALQLGSWIDEYRRV